MECKAPWLELELEARFTTLMTLAHFSLIFYFLLQFCSRALFFFGFLCLCVSLSSCCLPFLSLLWFSHLHCHGGFERGSRVVRLDYELYTWSPSCLWAGFVFHFGSERIIGLLYLHTHDCCFTDTICIAMNRGWDKKSFYYSLSLSHISELLWWDIISCLFAVCMDIRRCLYLCRPMLLGLWGCQFSFHFLCLQHLLRESGSLVYSVVVVAVVAPIFDFRRTYLWWLDARSCLLLAHCILFDPFREIISKPQSFW